MKRLVVLLALLSLSLSVQAQTPLAVQTAYIVPVGIGATAQPAASYTKTLSKPVTAGHTLFVLATIGVPAIQDSQNNTWSSVGQGLWITTANVTGTETITFSFPAATYSDILILELPQGYVLDTIAPLATGNGTLATSNPITPTAGDFVIGYGWNATTNYDTATVGAGFGQEPSSNVYEAILSDTIQTSGPLTSSTTWSGSVNWIQGIVALKPAVPPVPNVTLVLNLGSTAVFDDGTAILPGPVSVSQVQNPTTNVGIGTLNSDATGNLSGTLVVNPNWVDANGNLTFIFGLPVAPNVFAYPVPVAQFQHGATGLTLNLVLYKQGALAIKSQTLGLTP